MKTLSRPLGALAVVTFALSLAACGTASGGGSPQAATVIPGGETLNQFQSYIKGKVTQASPGGFGVSGAKTVNCFLPKAWTPGATFTCYVYQQNSTELGEVDITVVNTQSGDEWNTNMAWVPS